MSAPRHFCYANALCSGCGVCTGVCPPRCLEMRENACGEYRPALTAPDRCLACGRCMKVCPFESTLPQAPRLAQTLFADVPGIRREAGGELGAWRNAYLGHAPGYRARGASGGMASWFLDTLLQREIVDAVICVGHGTAPDALLQYVTVRDSDTLRACAGSAYYPVHLQQVLADLAEREGRYAVIGMPCFIRALRLAALVDRRLAAKLPVMAGLVCGHLPGKALVDYLAAGGGRTRQDLARLQFRIREPRRPAWDYGVRLDWTDGSHTTSFGSGDFGYVFWNRAFQQEACMLCDDIYARCADIVFMDAWLPGYREAPEGASLVLTRSALSEALLQEACGEHLQPVAPAQVLAAQERLRARAGAPLRARLALRRRANYTQEVAPDPSPVRWRQRLAARAEARLFRRVRARVRARDAGGAWVEAVRREIYEWSQLSRRPWLAPWLALKRAARALRQRGHAWPAAGAPPREGQP